MGTDKDWEKWGATDPYFGVLSSQIFRANKLDQSAKDAFFASGENHVNKVIQTIRDNFDARFTPKSVLDFGCGVGRLVIPFARMTDEVAGVDVSPSMLSEASKNCTSADIGNKVTFIQSGDPSCVKGQFDLVHSYIVFQHIPWRRGRSILRTLSGLVATHGYLAVHVFTSCNAPLIIQLLVRLRYLFPPANWVRNILRGRPPLEPAMQLHAYDIEAITRDLEASGFGKILYVDEPTENEFCSTFLFAQRSRPNGVTGGL